MPSKQLKVTRSHLLRTLTDDPALPALIERMEAPALARLIDHIGLEDSGQLIALASTNQSLSYQLVLRGPASTSGTVVGEGNLDPDLNDDDIAKLAKAVQESTLRDHVIAEINLARFIRGVTESLKTQGSDLVNRLMNYQEVLADEGSHFTERQS